MNDLIVFFQAVGYEAAAQIPQVLPLASLT